ncbi:hypothetical protein DENSPDRAFT_876602 [Dentipellis sp. KUC8613]|nr:hypothetical protein DENSPDRAFT_876602 [Dentipellis sp. KUC8613]
MTNSATSSDSGSGSRGSPLMQCGSTKMRPQGTVDTSESALMKKQVELHIRGRLIFDRTWKMAELGSRCVSLRNEHIYKQHHVFSEFGSGAKTVAEDVNCFTRDTTAFIKDLIHRVHDAEKLRDETVEASVACDRVHRETEQLLEEVREMLIAHTTWVDAVQVGALQAGAFRVEGLVFVLIMTLATIHWYYV